MFCFVFSDETHVVIAQNNSFNLWRKTSEKRKPKCINQSKTLVKVRFMYWGIQPTMPLALLNQLMEILTPNVY